MHRVAFTVGVLSLVVAVLGVGSAGRSGPGTDGATLPASHVVVDGRYGGVLVGGPPRGTAKARTDTIYLLGGPGRFDGAFQNAQSAPDWHGWYGVDLTQITTSHWHIDTYNAAPLDPNVVPNHAYWCGECFDNACGCGYGNNYHEHLDWYGTVPDPSAPTTVRVTARLQYDNEPGYDYLYLLVERAGGMYHLQNWNGVSAAPIDVDVVTTVDTADYVGPHDDQVRLRWRAMSDGGWSDADCIWDTEGHSQLDNVTVFFNGVAQTFDDFETGAEAARWRLGFPQGVGDFAHIWRRLADLDPCHENFTPQVAFIDGMDNGEWIVPGTGGTLGDTWTYGPGGYVLNHAGGLAGPNFSLANEIWSPPLALPPGAPRGAELAFDVYNHLPLGCRPFYWVWHIQASTDGSVSWGDWVDRDMVYHSMSPTYQRAILDVTDLLPPDCTHIRLALGVLQWGVWCWEPDPTPAPYFDNVAFKVYTFDGPSITAREIDLAQDAFPASGTIDYATLGGNSVRFDMARNVSPPAHLRNDPGDSIIVDVVPIRSGSTLPHPPRLHFSLRRNLLFDPFRTAGLPDEGEVDGRATYDAGGQLVANRYNFDLPDTGFFFPGDVIHYFIRAVDSLGGVALLPADTSGFAAFPADASFVPLRYPATFIVRALPTMRSATEGDVPPVLWWNDFGTRGGENEWYTSLGQLGYREGIDFDAYYTNGPSSGVGNGLGGRATAAQLAGYRALLYTAGDLGSVTLSNGDFARDPSRDLQVLDAWLRLGGRRALLTGDDLLFDLNRSGTVATAFRDTWLGLTYSSTNVSPQIGNQTSPQVAPAEDNPMGMTTRFAAYGTCPTVADFDAVVATGTGQRILRFCDPGGAPAYSPAAGILCAASAYDANVVTLPYDLMHVVGLPEDEGPLPARTRLLAEILTFFGESGGSVATNVPDAAGVLAVTCHPNPFNPRVRIDYRNPVRCRLQIRIYTVRGEFVKELLDEVVEGGAGSLSWDGTDDGGRAVAAGVYFCEARGGGPTVVSKLALIR